MAKAIPSLGRKTAKKRLIRKYREWLSFRKAQPKKKPIPLWVGLATFGALALIGMSLGAAIATHVFFGVCTLIGLIIVTENNSFIRGIVYRSNRLLDIIIFVASIIAFSYLGITMVAGITFGSLGYSMVYAPYMRDRIDKNEV